MQPLGEVAIVELTKAVIELGGLAMDFSRIERTCVTHVDGTPESDADHTVMLAWLAPALADLINERVGYSKYPLGMVAQFAAVHDAAEVYAGDTPTHKITAEEYAAKDLREAEATARLHNQFRGRLPWFAHMLVEYEKQTHPAARFVRSVDKIMPKVVHCLNMARDLWRASMTEDDFRELYERQRAQVVDWCPEPLLLQLYDELCGEIVRHYQSLPPAVPQPDHELVVYAGSGNAIALRHNKCEHTDMSRCPVTVAQRRFLEVVSVPLAPGAYPVAVKEDGLTFVGKQD